MQTARAYNVLISAWLPQKQSEDVHAGACRHHGHCDKHRAAGLSQAQV